MPRTSGGERSSMASKTGPSFQTMSHLKPRLHFARPTMMESMAGMEESEVTERCQCGCAFLPDSAFCRMCGARRSPSTPIEESGISGCFARQPSPASVGLSEGESLHPHRRPSVVTSEKEFFEIRNHFDCPTAWNLTLMQVGMSLGYSAYMMTSWTYVTMRMNETFPVCAHQWPYSWEMRFFCNCSILSFWCCPLLCCILLVIFFYRELLHTRLYYVMLTHRVLLDFTNESFWDARPVRWMVVFLFAGLLSYPLGNQMTFEALKLTLPYWIPVASFSGMIYGYWDLESRLLSLAKFVEENVTFAKQHLALSYFIRDYVAEAAYWNLRANFAPRSGTSGGDDPRYTGQYMEMLVRECERLESLENHLGENHLDELAAAREASDARLNVQQWHPDYWVSDFLYTKSIVDDPKYQERPRDEFRFWFRIYFCYSCFMAALLLYFLLCTVVSHFHHQQIITGSVWTELFKFKNVADELEVQTVEALAHRGSPIVHTVHGLVHF